MLDASQAELLQRLGTLPDPTLWLVDENLPAEDIARLSNTLDKELTVVTNRYDLYKQLREAGFDTHLSDFDLTDLPRFRSIVYRISKEKALTHHCINQSLQQLTSDGELVLIGNKQDGIKSISKNTAALYDLPNQTKKLGTTYCTTFAKPADPTPRLATENYSELRLIQHPELPFYSKPGLFGWDKVDKGSRLLVQTLNERAEDFNHSHRVLDLGCGWGYLLLATAEWPFTDRCGTDNNIAAVTAARRNLDYYGLAGEILLDDCGSQLQKPFDLVLCNPPFHHGFGVNETLLRRFLSRTADLIHNHGQAVFVVNEFIPLAREAGNLFGDIELLKHEAGFRVFRLSL